jgi:site-specific recombinase XerD
MAHKLEKQGDKWTFRYVDIDGKQKRYTCASQLREEAKQEQLSFLTSKKGNKVFKTIEVFINEYLTYSRTNKRPKTVKTDESALKHFKRHISKYRLVNLSDITTKHIEDFKSYRIDNKKNVKASSINRNLDVIKAMFRKAEEWGYIQNNPCKFIKSLKEPIKSPRFLSLEEIKNLRKQAKGLYLTMVEIAINAGLRISEVYNLQWKDVNFDKEAPTISVVPKHNFIPKDYESRTIPLNANLFVYLHKLRGEADSYIIGDEDNTRPCLSVISVAFTKLFKKCKIAEASFHTLRHTFASHLVINGVSIYTVSKLLGHSSVDITQVYAHLSKEHLKDAVTKLPY